MSDNEDPDAPLYCTVAQVKLWAPYSERDFPDNQVPDIIQSASREVTMKTNHLWVVGETGYDDIEIITAYLAGSMINGTLGNLDRMKAFRDQAMSKLKTLLDSGGGPGSPGGGITDVINVFSSPTSYYLAKSLNPDTSIRPFKSIK